MAVAVEDGARFQPIILEPGAPGAFACFGSWENAKTCEALQQGDDPLQGCPQAQECRAYTLEQNPPTTRFRAKPRRDGRFEVQQFREFIGDQETYALDVQDGQVLVTYPGDRKVPKSKRFFLHTKHVTQAGMVLEQDLELVVSLDHMLVRQAGAVEASAGGSERARGRREEEDPEARRRRIAERLRQKASAEARKGDDDTEDLDDLDIEIDVEEGEGEGDDDGDEEDVDLDLEDLDIDDLGKLSSSEARKLSELRAKASGGDGDDAADDDDDDAADDGFESDDDEDLDLSDDDEDPDLSDDDDDDDDEDEDDKG